MALRKIAKASAGHKNEGNDHQSENFLIAKTNSPNWYHKKCMVNSEKNFYFDTKSFKAKETWMCCLLRSRRKVVTQRFFSREKRCMTLHDVEMEG